MIKRKSCHQAACDACGNVHDNGEYEPHWADPSEAIREAQESEWTYDPVTGQIVCRGCALDAGTIPRMDDDDREDGDPTVAEVVATTVTHRVEVEAAARVRYGRELLPNQYGGEATWEQLSSRKRADLVSAEQQRRTP